MRIVLLVIFVVVMLLMALALVGGVQGEFARASAWLPFVALLVLGIVVFVPIGGPPPA